MPRLSRILQNLTPGLRRLLEFLCCLRSPPQTPEVSVGPRAQRSSHTSRALEDVETATVLAPEGPSTPTPVPSSTHPPDDVEPSTSDETNGNAVADSGTPVVCPISDDLQDVVGAAIEICAPSEGGSPEDQTPTLGDHVRGAVNAMANARLVGEHPSNAARLVEDGVAAADQWSARIDDLLKKISAFSVVADLIGELHPYAKIVTGVIQAGIKPILQQKARDEDMKTLVEEMIHAYEEVSREDLLGEVQRNIDDPRCKLLARLAQQTAECATFIQEQYGELRQSFLKRAWKNIPQFTVDEKLRHYSKAFVDLRQKITAREASITMGIVSTISMSVSHIDTKLTLQDLQYAEGTGRQRSKGCLLGTRKDTLDSLASWIMDRDASRARFITGVAGRGKSTIAHSTASQFEALGHLAAFFAFNRTKSNIRPCSLFSTLARELADWNADFKRELCSVLSEKGRLAKSDDVMEQWEELIVRPAKKVVFVGPVLIVVDALDECTNLGASPAAFDRNEEALKRERDALVECLTKRVGELPENFRVLVTSRSDPDVMTALRDRRQSPNFFDDLDLDQCRDEAAESILLYARQKMCHKLDDRQIRELAAAADGLFEWAAIVCRYLDPGTGANVAVRYADFFGGNADISNRPWSHSLEQLYAKILGQLFPEYDTRILERFRDVMAHVLYAAEPLSTETIEAIRGAAGLGKETDDILLPMGSLLSGVGDRTALIHPLHTSFRDYLTKRNQSHAWRVDPGDIHNTTALGALQILNRSLHFNIANVESSYTRNTDISDLEDRIRTLPADVVYASRNWSYHIHMTSSADVKLKPALSFLLANKLLFWLEVASLCRFTNRATSALHIAARFFEGSNDVALLDFVNDAILFVRNFIEPIRISVPHIYISALSFSPTTSMVRQAFISNSSLLPTISGLSALWPLARDLVYPNRDSVLCIAYSPDGHHIVVGGSHRGDVRIFEAENTHETVLVLAHDERDRWVYSISYSPDGKSIAAGYDNGQVRRWDAKTGDVLGQSQLHADDVFSVCFTSDGLYGVSASADQTVLRWDAETGEPVGDPLRGHTDSVLGVTCSASGKFIVSTSYDGTIRVWNAYTGQLVDAIPSPEGLPLHAVSRSPDGDIFAVGAAASDGNDVPIYLFDLVRRTFSEPMRGHSGAVSAIVWSPDGKSYASASSDRTIRLWDTTPTGRSSIAVYGHMLDVTSLVFSQDGQLLISGASDGSLPS